MITRTSSITLTHRVEMAHRLSHPDSPPKCQSVHGHSWTVDVTLEGDLDLLDMVIEFGRFKRAWRALFDDRYDHCLVVKRGDLVALAILAVQPDARITMIDAQPTTEALALDMLDQTTHLLTKLGARAKVARLHLQETPSNGATAHVQTAT